MEEDTNLFVNYANLYSDGEVLVNNSISISDNIENINELLKDWESWLGKDSAAYVNNLSATLSLLLRYASELNNIGTYMKNVSDDYKTTLNSHSYKG